MSGFTKWWADRARRERVEEKKSFTREEVRRFAEAAYRAGVEDASARRYW